MAMPRLTKSLTKDGQIADLRKQVTLLKRDNRQLRQRLETQADIIEGYREAAGISDSLTGPEPCPDPQTPARRIREAREAAGLTIHQLAEQIGCSPGTIGGWEQGRRVPRSDYARKLKDVLGIEIDRDWGIPR